MQYYTDKKYEKERNGRVFHIKWEMEEYADLDDLGEFTSKNDDYIVDRQDGTLRGTMPPEPDEPDTEEPEPDDYPDTVEGQAEYDADFNQWEKAEIKYGDDMSEWEENGQDILANSLPRMERGQHRYFKPFAGDVDPEKDLETWVKYAVQDYLRASSYGNDWVYLYCVVSTMAPACSKCGHAEELTAAVGMIESDIGDACADEFIDDLIYDLEKQLEKYEEDK